ncbi:MAG: BON domain-containing protein [Gemmatimonadaceae bacterium]
MNTDMEVKKSVLAELAWEPRIAAAHIGVAAHDGVVTLTGHIESYSQKCAAENAALRVKGVKAVAQEMEVRLPTSVQRGDEEIAAAALTQLKWNSIVPKDAIKISVQHGWLTLTGTVDWHFEAQEAAEAVATLWGVVGVTNKVSVKTRVNTTDLSEDIKKALHRSSLEPKNVEVSANGGMITLTGTVKSWQDRELAGTTAWAAPGATSVENDIAVSF